MTRQWTETNQRYLDGNQRTSDVVGGLGAVAKVFRMALQSAVLGVGAYLVIHQEATAGIIIAGSILSARALAPVDTGDCELEGLRGGSTELAAVEPAAGSCCRRRVAPTLLDAPSRRLLVENVSIIPPGDQKVVVQDVTFALEAGNGLGIIGPSGSGKSSLVRALVGVWSPVRGTVRLDSAALNQWSADKSWAVTSAICRRTSNCLTVPSRRISARHDPEASAEAIIAAAKQAGVHELIVGMRDGYDTQIGPHGSVLSAGQAQRIALARALYGDPFLVVLDEPNSNLDAEGDEALTRAIRTARARGAIVIVVAHRPVGIEGVDLLLVMKEGRVQAFGPKDTVLGQVLQRPGPHTPPIKIVSDAGAGRS